MAIFFLILVVLSAILLILMVMLQDEQGEGLGGIFGGGSGTPFGSRAGNVLTRITTVLAVVFVSCTLLLALQNDKNKQVDSTIDTARQEQYEEGASGWYIKTGETDEVAVDNGDSSLLLEATDVNNGDTPADDAVTGDTDDEAATAGSGDAG